MDSKKKRIRWYILAQILLCVGLAAVSYGLVFNRTRVLGLQDQKNVDGTKTALVGTAQALLGPFPTATVPTSTSSVTVTATPLISATPTVTPTITLTPSKTPTRFMSATPKGSGDSGSGHQATNTKLAPLTHPSTEPPTEPPVDPTKPPVEPTDPPAEPTDPPATEPPSTQPPVSE